jgi:putative copper resistance protein D
MEDALYICSFIQFASPGGTAFEGWLRRVVLVSAIFALASALALLLCQSAAMAGAAAAAFDLETVAAVLLETRFGRVWRWHLLIAIVLVPVCCGRPGRRQPVILILSFGLLASLGWTGHAAMDKATARIARELNQTMHLLAAERWIGGRGMPPRSL